MEKKDQVKLAIPGCEGNLSVTCVSPLFSRIESADVAKAGVAFLHPHSMCIPPISCVRGWLHQWQRTSLLVLWPESPNSLSSYTKGGTVIFLQPVRWLHHQHGPLSFAEINSQSASGLKSKKLLLRSFIGRVGILPEAKVQMSSHDAHLVHLVQPERQNHTYASSLHSCPGNNYRVRLHEFHLPALLENPSLCTRSRNACQLVICHVNVFRCWAQGLWLGH